MRDLMMEGRSKLSGGVDAPLIEAGGSEGVYVHGDADVVGVMAVVYVDV